MTDLTQRQLHDIIVRSLDKTGKRMAAKYRAAPKERAAVQKVSGRKRAKAAASKSVRRRGRR
jgi:hypothetical protein